MLCAVYRCVCHRAVRCAVCEVCEFSSSVAWYLEMSAPARARPSVDTQGSLKRSQARVGVRSTGNDSRYKPRSFEKPCRPHPFPRIEPLRSSFVLD